MRKLSKHYTVEPCPLGFMAVDYDRDETIYGFGKTEQGAVEDLEEQYEPTDNS